MPQGFIITKWSDEGLETTLAYPDELSLDYDDLMRIFYAHITGAGEAGNLLVRLEKSRANVNSFFTGMAGESEDEEPYMINLVLDLDEEPDLFGEAAISEFNENILKYLSNKDDYEMMSNLRNYLKNVLFLLDRLKNMTKEQRIAQIFSTKKGRAILEILQEKPRSKPELQGLLEEKLNKLISNLDMTLDPFFKTDLIKQDWIEGLPDIYIFLLADFSIYRKPAENLVSQAKKGRPNSFLARKYMKKVKDFFKNYRPSLEDSIKIAKAMVNPDYYDFVILFRNKPYPMKKIPKSPRNAFVNTSEILKQMEEDKIIQIIKNKENVEWVYLFSDCSATTFFPSYLIELIRKEYISEKMTQDISIKHLELLEKAYKK
jgi:hypothetical protein